MPDPVEATAPAPRGELSFRNGALLGVLSADGATRAAAQELRARVFRCGGAADECPHDPAFLHGIVRAPDAPLPRLAFRIRRLDGVRDLCDSYTGGFYDLAPLARLDDPVAELGRFCRDATRPDPDALRLAWAMIAAFVERAGAGMLIGCSSFAGTDVARHAQALSLLRRHLGPAHLRPRACRGVRHLPLPPERRDARPAMLPPLLRSYLGLGGWVGEQVVIDRALGTLHVFTGLAIASIPAARAARLRHLAASSLVSPLDAGRRGT